MRAPRYPFVVLAILLLLLCSPLSSLAQSGISTSSTVFLHNHQLHDIGGEVRSLQQFLNSHGFIVAATGPGSPGNETTFFGARLYRALIRFQAAHGLPLTGFFGPKTRASISSEVAPSTAVELSVLPDSSKTPNMPPKSAPPATTTATTSTPWWGLQISISPGFGGGGGDTIPPVITLSGANPLTIADGGTYTEPGASAADNVDGSDTVSISGLVNTSVPGTYTLTYSTTDRAGNKAAPVTRSVIVTATTYYVSPSGNDSNNGTSQSSPWKTIAKINTGTYHPGDAVLLQGGQSFSGCLSFSGSNVTSTSTSGTPFIVGSYGSGNFTLAANCAGSQAAAVNVVSVNNLTLQDCTLTGNTGGAQYGVWIHNASSTQVGNVTVQRCDISGFYTATASDYGAEIFVTGTGGAGLNHVTLLNNTLHGASGVTSPDDNGISGYGSGQNVTNVLYQGNTIYNIGGKASNISEGNGILFGGVNGGVGQFNTVHDMGANTTTCGGPVGILAFDANNITMQFNEVYNTKPASYVSGCDWDGFDLDGGVTNSVMQYNYAHGNYGQGFLLWAGGTWGPNTVRYNISENDDFGNHDDSTGSITFAGHGANPAVANIYNNTVWQGNPGPASERPVAFAIQNDVPTGGVVANNIFAVSSDEFNRAYFLTTNLLSPSALTFKNNAYYATGGGSFNARYGGTIYSSLSALQAVVPGGETSATTSSPQFAHGGSGGTCGGYSTTCPGAYTLLSSSPLIGAGLNLTNSPYSLSVGAQDYFGNAVPHSTGTGYNTGAYGAVTPPDTTPPSVSFTVPTAGSTVSGSSVTLAATASDNIAIASVQFKVDGGNIGSAITSSPYTTTWDSTSVGNGAHTLAAVAKDTSGNYATSSISVTDSNNPPVISAASSTPGTSNATISWTTDTAASSQVAYGTSVSYTASTTLDSTLVTSHTVTITGLTGSTTYHFQILSTDGGGRLATSSDQMFTTTASGVVVTWNPADKTANMLLSNGNLTAKSNAAGRNEVRATNPIVAGEKKYVEYTIDKVITPATQFAVGIAPLAHSFANYLGQGNDFGYGNDGTNFKLGANQGTTVTYTTGDNIGMAVDIPNKKIWFRKNGGNWDNNASHDPATNIGGFDLTAIFNGVATSTTYAIIDMEDSTDQVTAKFSNGSWTYSAPTGFSSAAN